MNRQQLTVIGIAALAALGGGLFAPASQAQSSNNGYSKRVVLDPGTVIPVTLNTELSSSQAQKGDAFTAAVDTTKTAYDNIMRGATVNGVVREATAQSGDAPGTLDLAFTRLTLSDGRSFAINGAPTSLDTKSLASRSDGVLVAKNTKKDEHLTYAGYGAGAGLLVGLLANHKLKIEDVLLGGLAGYAAGSVLQGKTQVHDVDLKPGTPMGVLLGNRVQYYHKTAASGVRRRSTSPSSGPHATFVRQRRQILLVQRRAVGDGYVNGRASPRRPELTVVFRCPQKQACVRMDEGLFF